MRTLLISVVALLAAAVAFLLLDTSGTGSSETGSRDANPAAGETAGAEAALETADATGARRERSGASVPEARPDAAPSANPDERCVVVATVVDGSGAPIEGAFAQLGSYDGWDRSGAGEDLAAFGMQELQGLRGFETRTDAEGRLRFDVPVPTVTRARMFVAGETFQDAATFHFGDRSDWTLPMLGAGVRDLGEIRLVATGAIRGRVTDAGGAPVEGARVSLRADVTEMPQRYARTGVGGEYLMAHVPAGTHVVEANRTDFLESGHPDVRVDVGVETTGVDLVLERAPRISGRVVDEGGAPVAGAFLSGWAKSEGRGLAARADDDGTFDVPLPQDEPYSLQVTHPDFEQWGDMDDKTVLFEPGTTGILVTLKRAQKARFHVVADETGDPIERFGLRVFHGTERRPGGAMQRWIPKLADHTGGVVETKADAGIDEVVAWAPGRVIAQEIVAWEDEGGMSMTLRLERGATVTGRLVDGDAPLADVPVEVVRTGRWTRVRDEDLTRRRATTDSEGRFTIEGVGPGTHRFTATPASRAEVVVDGIEAKPPETVDLGDVEVPEAGAVEGLVRVPLGVDPGGIVVVLGDWGKDEVTTTTDASGRFRFDAVAPEMYLLKTHKRPGVLAEGARAACIVEAGETATVEIDATDRALVPVAVTVDLGTEELFTGLRVILRPTDPEMRVRAGLLAESDGGLGQVDERGLAQGHVRALGECEVQVFSGELGTLTHPTARVAIETGRPVEESVRFDLAAARLLLPAAPPLPDSGQLLVELRSASGDRRTVRAPIGASGVAPHAAVQLDGRTLALSALIPGEFTITVRAEEKDAGWVEFTAPDGTTREERESLWKYSGTATFVAGETVEVTLD